MSLLNLPETMTRYGPLINLWEGSNQGEGYLRYAKPMITNIHSKNWQVNAVKKLQNKKTFDSIVDYHLEHNCVRSDIKLKYDNMKRERDTKMFVCYKTVNEVYANLKRKMPLSCVGTTTNKYYCIVRRGLKDEHLYGIELKFNAMETIHSLSMTFHCVSIDKERTDLNLDSVNEAEIIIFMLLLPKIGTSGYIIDQDRPTYYIVNSEWQELGQSDIFSTPRSPGCIYR